MYIAPINNHINIIDAKVLAIYSTARHYHIPYIEIRGLKTLANALKEMSSNNSLLSLYIGKHGAARTYIPFTKGFLYRIKRNFYTHIAYSVLPFCEKSLLSKIDMIIVKEDEIPQKNLVLPSSSESSSDSDGNYKPPVDLYGRRKSINADIDARSSSDEEVINEKKTLVTP